jgi:hypothetical protein
MLRYAKTSHVVATDTGACAPGYILSLLRSLVLLFAFATWSNLVCAQQEAEVVTEEEVAEYEVLMEATMEEEADEEFELPPDPETAKVLAHVAVRRALMKRVCDLTGDQEKQLSGMDRKWLSELSKKNEPKPVGGAIQPGIIGMFFGVQPQQRRVVRKQNMTKKVDAALLDVLNEDQKERLDEETKAADDFRSSATADALIEALQPRLDMSDEQRVEIKKKMLPWVSRSDIVVTYYFNGNNYYPQIPMHLLDALNAEQKQIYQGLRCHLWTHGQVNDGNQPIVIED